MSIECSFSLPPLPRRGWQRSRTQYRAELTPCRRVIENNDRDWSMTYLEG